MLFKKLKDFHEEKLSSEIGAIDQRAKENNMLKGFKLIANTLIKRLEGIIED